ncbi:MAG: nucleotide exchange factor GrpE [Thermodesulfobacteriota bacterium]|nr:nucleotide exchange factor GrpE [Thermodesulfobacteriota bacterium]
MTGEKNIPAPGQSPKAGEEPFGRTDGQIQTNEEAGPDAAESAFADISLSDEELRALCKKRLCENCPEKTEADNIRLRALAEMENLRKRLAREKEDFCKFASEGVLADLLPILDNLGLALEHGRGVTACKDLTLGVEMTQKIFQEALKKHGLEPVGKEGEAFSPEIHEAVGQEEREDMEEGLVCKLLQTGYKLNNRTLRPAKVVVSKTPCAE